jgi:predicted regulator of Ras-like GTPase activity (Roadblock/LC7/MglB family)
MTDGIGFLGQQEIQRLDDLLVSYLNETGVRSAMLVDRAGRLLTIAGEPADFDGITFASLAAADFAASDQLAVLLGEREFASLYHHGDQQSMYLADVGGRAILAALFDAVTTLGMVRITTREFVPRLGAVLDDVVAHGAHGERVHMDEAWVEEVEGEIDRLFSE